MTCPKCGVEMKEIDSLGVKVLRCPGCHLIVDPRALERDN